MNDKIILVRIMPNGYAKASEEVRNYILYLHDEIDDLQQENEKIKELVEIYKFKCFSYPDLKLRIDKAIEYIEKHFEDDEGVICKITGEMECETNYNF